MHRQLEALALVFAILLFCLPLFVGLGATDLRNDEAIYSYAVDRILETGNWLLPRSIPDDAPFLEKPPLKFWMVAAPIAAGLLPHDEFGLRFLDALFGAVAFVYVFLLGRWLAGPVCGLTAVLVSFSLPSLVFSHGLRTNNMEASLVLSYCGAVYHFARWAQLAAEPAGGRPGERTLASPHAIAVTAYFVLGFMTKFVAVFFLPLVCLTGLLLSPGGWQRLCSTWRAWIAPAVMAVVLCAPWFVYLTYQFGWHFWRVIAGMHVLARMTGVLDPLHLNPWYAYFTWTWQDFAIEHIAWLGVAGLLRLVVGAWSGQPRLARLILVWWLLPIAVISLGTSKLFHYAYPFLPPLALGLGWLLADVARLIERHVIARLIAATARLAGRLRVPHPFASTAWHALQTPLLALAALAVVVSVWTMVAGTATWRAGDVTVFRNSSIIRPLLVATALAALAGYGLVAGRLGIATLLVMLLPPVATYHMTAAFLSHVERPLRALSDCAVDVRRSGVPTGAGFYNTASLVASHPYYYYLRRVGPWLLTDRPADEQLQRRLFVDGAQTPIVMTRKAYELLTVRVDALWTRSREEAGATGTNGSAPRPLLTGVAPEEGVVVLLPGPYQRCTAAGVAAGGEEVGDHPQQRPRWR